MSNRSGTPYSAPTDADRRPVMLGVSTADGITPLPLEVDPLTGQLQVSSSGGGGGGTQYTDGATPPAHPIGTMPIFNNSGTWSQVSSSQGLPVAIVSGGGSGGTSSNFSSAFPTAGTAIGATDGTNMQPLKVDGSDNLLVKVNTALPAGTNVIGHTITDSGSTTAVTQATASNLNATVVGTGTFAVQATQSGTWNINNVSGTVSLPTGASTAAKQPALGTAGTASSDVITVQGITSMTPLKVDGSGVTQPISGTVTANAGTNLNTSLLALESGGNLATIATNTTGLNNTVGTAGSAIPSKGLIVQGSDGTNARAISTTTAGVVKVDLSSTAANSTAVKVDGSAVTQPVSGTVTANQGTSPWVNNTSQINGVTPLMGNGVTGTGSQRVTIASDNTAFSVNATLSAETTKVIGTINIASAQTLATVTTVSAVTAITNALPAGSNLMGKVGIDQTTPGTTNAVVDTPVTSGGLSIVTGSVGATATAIKASAGQLYGYHLFNTTAAVAYVQVFNVAAASVTLGTTAPTFSIGIPASGGVTVNFDKGIAFGTAISFGCTTTRTGSSGATCDVNFFYK